METVLEQIPQAGEIQLTIHVSARQNYSAKAARKLVGRFVADEISYLLRAEEPTLVVSDNLYWRVPITLALPTTGTIDVVGTIDVNVETGQLLITPAQVMEITRHAERLAAEHSSPSSTFS